LLGNARVVCKQHGILAGLNIVEYTFKAVDAMNQIKLDHKDGDWIESGETVILVSGKIASILEGERVALNFLSHLSGIATLTYQYVQEVKGLMVKITDTRKTTPLLRSLEKDAVRIGGGYNHRMGLYDMVLIKENHIQAAGGIKRAIEQTYQYLSSMNIEANVEIETTNIDEVHEALTCNIDRVMLDNMTIEEIKEAVALINKQVEVEVSGGVNLENVRQIALCGVDYISVGALTHSAPAFDFSLLLDRD
jgi:nicotinate-nucleotide pyrophosphorylase (carboxylating)